MFSGTIAFVLKIDSVVKILELS